MKRTQTKKNKRSHWGYRVLWGIGGVILVFILLVTWYLFPFIMLKESEAMAAIPLEFESDSGNVSAGFGLKRIALGWFHSTTPFEKKVRVLFLGFDENGNKKPGRTDSILYAEIDPKKGVGMISIPRDLWVPIPTVVDGRSPNESTVLSPTTSDTDSSVDTDSSADTDSSTSVELEYGRINTVFRLGNRRFGKGYGHKALKMVLKDELDLDIDYTVAIHYGGFKQIVDVLGGVEVDVQCPIRDNFIDDSAASGYVALDVPAGKQILSSDEALRFMRSRHGRTDMDRSRRQQLVLLGMRKQILGEHNFLQLPTLIAQLMKYVKMDMDITTALRLAVTLKSVSRNLHGLVLRPPIVVRTQTSDKKSVLALDKEKYMKIKKKLYASALPGLRVKKTCPNADVAINWRSQKKNQNTSE